VYALKSLTAKAVCEALLNMFSNVGVSSKIISDRKTNFSSRLTQEMLRHLGCSPVFATPGHPQTSGLVERFNKTCKDILFHVIQQHGRQWHRMIPFTVWALRKVPNSTTGTSPYTGCGNKKDPTTKTAISLKRLRVFIGKFSGLLRTIFDTNGIKFIKFHYYMQKWYEILFRKTFF